MTPLRDLPFVEPGDRAEWRSWLEANHGSSAGIWLGVGKKGGTATRLTYDEAVEEALCFGWIDSTVRKLDEQRFQQLFTPRKPGSHWSRSNKERVERLMAAGLMAPAGIAAVERARANGAWEQLDDVDALVMPEDLARALEADPAAAAYVDSLSPSNRKLVLYWVGNAKREETRARRIAATLEAAREGRMPYP